MPEYPTRRQFVQSGVGLVTVGAAGCGGIDGERRTVQNQSTAAVIGSTPGQVIFDGGGRERFMEALGTLREGPAETLHVEPGTYRFEPPPGQAFTPHLKVQNLRKASIEGNDARFVMTDPSRGGVQLLGGADITLRNLTLDYDPVPFTQGTIAELSDDTRRITLEIDDDYPLPSHPMFDAANAVSGSIHTADGRFISGFPQRGGLHVRFSSMAPLDGRRFVLTRSNPINQQGLAVGRRMAIGARRAFGISFLNVARPTVEGVTVRAAPGMAVKTTLCDGPRIRDVTIAPPPDSGRLIGSVADGIHVYDARRGPSIERCRLEQIGDDGIVVDSIMQRVSALRDERTVEVHGESLKSIQPGDPFEVLAANGVRKGSLSTVTDVRYRESYANPWVPAHPEALTFDSSIRGAVEPGDFLVSTATTNPGFVVRNNLVRNTIANSVRLSAGPGLVEGNRLDGCSLHGIWMRCDTSGTFSPKRWSNDVTIRDNRISRSGLSSYAALHTAGIHAVYWSADDGVTRGRPHRNLAVAGNEIIDTAGPSVILEDAEGIRAESNRLARPNQVYAGEYGVGIGNVGNGVVTGNIVSGSDENLSYFGWRERTEGIMDEENVLVIDGNRQPAGLIRWVPVTLSFDRTVVPEGGDLHLAFRCHGIALQSDDGEIVRQIDIGGSEDGIQFGSGVYESNRDGDDTWRWFGGSDDTADLQLIESELNRTGVLALRGTAFEDGLSAVVGVAGRRVGELTFDAGPVRTYRVAL